MLPASCKNIVIPRNRITLKLLLDLISKHWFWELLLFCLLDIDLDLMTIIRYIEHNLLLLIAQVDYIFLR